AREDARKLRVRRGHAGVRDADRRGLGREARPLPRPVSPRAPARVGGRRSPGAARFHRAAVSGRRRADVIGYDPTMRQLRSALILLPLVALGGAASDPPPLDSYFSPTQYAAASCNSVDQELAGVRQMRLYVNGSSGALLPATQGIASYYRRHSLSFVVEAQ